MCYFTCEAQKLPFNAILTWFLVLGKIQVYGKDDDHCWWRHRPPAAPPSTNGKIVSKYCNITKKFGEGSHQQPPPPPPCTTVGVGVYAYVRGLILGCKLRDEDCSANVFSSKPWSVLRIVFITYIKAKSNYIIESVLIVCQPMAWHKDARQTSMKMFICFVPARLNFLSAILLNGKFACLRIRRNTISLHWVWARYLYTLRKYLRLPKSSLTKRRGHEVAA